MDKQQLMYEISNFIEYYSSDDAEREKMLLALKDYINEVLNN